MSDEKVFTTADKVVQDAVRQVELKPKVSGGSLTIDEMETRKRPGGERLRTLDLIRDCALDSELEELRKTIEARKAAEPKNSWWRCDKCGLEIKLFRPPQNRKAACFQCNRFATEGGGWMVEMTGKEAEDYEKRQKAEFDRLVAADKERAARLKPVEEARLMGLGRKG